jgi:hypothetical protein
VLISSLSSHPDHIVDTGRCTVDDITLQTDTQVFLEIPFDVTLVPKHLRTRDPAGEPCPVDVTLGTSDRDRLLSIIEPERTVDLSGRPSWTITPTGLGMHSLVLAIRTRCLSVCSGRQPGVTVFVDRDAAYRVARTALQRVADSLVFATRRDALQAHVPGDARLTVGVGGPVAVANVTEVALRLDSIDDKDVTRPSPQGLTGGPQVLRFTMLVTPPSHDNYDVGVGLTLVATLRGDSIEIPITHAVRVNVREKSWFARVVIDNVAWVATLVGIPGTVGLGWVVQRTVRRRRRQNEDKDDDD